MSYQVLARKWRPANFSQMVGQEHVLQALANALDSNRLHHAYLFSGTRGVGKTTIARILAKCLNCEQGIGSQPCGECSSCVEVDQGRSVDLIEIDAASRTGVDDMRELLDNVQYAPTRSRFKIYLIDEVHMLSKHSFNALLKTLEEPPPHIKFLLATTDPQKVPVTVLSRCLQFNLKRMSKSQILAQLQFLTGQEEVAADDAALQQLASAADGSMRDALSLLDQAIGYGAGAVRQDAVEAMLGSISKDYLLRLFDALCEQRAAALLQAARQVIEHNPDYQRVCAEMIALLQQVALYQHDPGLSLDDEFDPGLLQKYGARWSPDEVQLYYQILLQGRNDLLICPDQASGFEMLMLRLIAFAPQADVTEAAGELKKKPELNAADPPPPDPELARPEAQAPPAPPPATEVPAAMPSDAAQAESGSAKAVMPDWTGLAYELGLSGIAQQLVANSELVEFSGDRLQLRLPCELHDLISDPIHAEILQALQQKLKVSLRLEISSTSEQPGQTPLKARQLREQRERSAAIDAIREDATVRRLRQAFGAELDESSVIKTDSNR